MKGRIHVMKSHILAGTVNWHVVQNIYVADCLYIEYNDRTLTCPPHTILSALLLRYHRVSETSKLPFLRDLMNVLSKATYTTMSAFIFNIDRYKMQCPILCTATRPHLKKPESRINKSLQWFSLPPLRGTASNNCH